DRVHGKNSRRASEGGGASSAPTDGPPAAADTHGKGRPKSLARGPITDAERREIVRHHRRGMDVTRIARRSGRSRSTVYRVLSANRLERLVEVDLSYIDSDEFRRDDADAVILDAAAPESTGRLSRPPSGLPAYLASLYTVPLLNRAQEQYWFRRMNYLKFKATDLRDKLQARKRRGEKALAEAERLVREVDDVKNFLIRSNLRLVVSLAKKKVATGRDFFEMVSDGNVSLIRAVEKFDYSKGNKFSTYATWAIVKNYARSIPAEHKQLDRFRTGNEEVFDASGADAAVPIRAELENAAQKRVLRKYLSRLEDRERSIMVARFGLEPGTEPLTLE
ncbi:MAG: sigma-70 family RNA polymerase sigma factor, partial [Planctomycetota bacterium]